MLYEIWIHLILGVQCEMPGALVNGTTRVVGDPSLTVGTKLSYSCKRGSGLSGPSERVCQSDGEWSGSEPKCLCKYFVLDL